MWLTRLALRNPVLILMVSLMAVVLGFVSLRNLSVDLFPDITLPVIRVATFYPGAGPSDIEKSITEPIERAVSASPGANRIESSSKQGVSIVSVWFDFGVNLDNAQFDVSQRVAQILNVLPPGVQQPFVLKFDVSNIPVASIQLYAEGIDERDLYDLAYNVIEPQIERLPGVASATVGGGKIRQMQVSADPDALRARGLTLLDIVNALRSSNMLLPSGNLRVGDRDYNVFSNSQLQDVATARQVVVQTPRGADGPSDAVVRVSDVARVEDATADQTEVVRIEGNRGVYLRIAKQPGANTIAVVDAVREALPKLMGVPANVKLEIGFDQSQYIRAAIGSLKHEALYGGLLAVAVILVFLTSLRATGIIAVAIPLSIIATFVLLYFTGQTLNVFTLGGLALGVGRLVDDSIVELENIHRHLGKGQSRLVAVLQAAQEVAMPILVSTITTIVVFFPVLFLTGVARNLFLPLALTISFALLLSFFVSRTVTPLLCYYTLDAGTMRTPLHPLGRAMLRMLDALDAGYARSLGWVLRHRAWTVLAVFALFGCSVFLTRYVGTEFFPASDESQMSVDFRAPIGTRVERTEQIAQRLEQIVRDALDSQDQSVVRTLLSVVGLPLGRSALFGSNTGPHSGSVRVNLVPPTERTLSDVEAAERVRSKIGDEFPGVRLFLSTGGIVKRIMNFGAAAPIDVEILGYDIEAGAGYAKTLAEKMRGLVDEAGRPLLTDVQISREDNYPELRVEVDRQKAGVLGLSVQQISQTVLGGLVGNTQFAPIQYTDPKTGNEYFVNVRLDDPHRAKISDLGDMVFRSPSGSMVSLSTVAQIHRDSGPVQVDRKYLQRIIDVTANVGPQADLGTATAATQRLVDETQSPEGFTVRLGGQSEAQRAAFSGLLFAAAMAIVLVYMVLASQFKSLIDPLVIMFSVPLGVGGVFVMLLVTRTTLSVNSFMGIIMMVGIVVSNGVLLVDFTNVLRRRGVAVREAVVEAGRVRLRPILMTSIATVAGLAPMALGFGEGSETNLPLARAVIGGLSVSTVLTLFLVPALYTVFDRFARRRVPTDEERALLRTAQEVGDAR